MANKDINKRREAYRKWASLNKEKRRAYQRVLYMAKKANPIVQKCIIEGCDNLGERHHPDYSKPEEIIWICRSHHRTMFHKTVCSICGDKAIGRGLCNRHYKQERKKNDPEYAARVKKQKKEYRQRHRK